VVSKELRRKSLERAQKKKKKEDDVKGMAGEMKQLKNRGDQPFQEPAVFRCKNFRV
jgi:hypothetical protein